MTMHVGQDGLPESYECDVCKREIVVAESTDVERAEWTAKVPPAPAPITHFCPTCLPRVPPLPDEPTSPGRPSAVAREAGRTTRPTGELFESRSGANRAPRGGER